MRLGRIASPDGVAFVSIDGELDDPGVMTAREIAEHPFGTPTFTGRSWPLVDVRLLAPMLASKVVCIGKNYADHIAEMGGITGPAPEDPVIFLKPNTAIIGPNVPIQLPADAFPVHHEGELAAVIGRPCKAVPAARAYENILGYTIANDVSARDQQKKDGQWMRAKGHDTFCPVGPWIDTTIDPSELDLRTEVNGEVRQSSNTSLMIRDVGAIIEWVSAVMTLLPGDLILTGTPEGVGPLEDGDTVSITVEGIGTLSNPVVRKGKSWPWPRKRSATSSPCGVGSVGRPQAHRMTVWCAPRCSTGPTPGTPAALSYSASRTPIPSATPKRAPWRCSTRCAGWA